jgi:hypothetical protein
MNSRAASDIQMSINPPKKKSNRFRKVIAQIDTPTSFEIETMINEIYSIEVTQKHSPK